MVLLAVFEVTVAPVAALTAVAEAVFITEPAVKSPATIVYVPIHERFSPGSK
jgi:hypothetical protein